jgi:hypothetical protein
MMRNWKTEISLRITSAVKNLNYDKIIDITDNSFTAILEGKSITTFVSTNNSTGVKLLDSSILQKYSLNQNYSNLFNPSTVISFSSPLKSFITLKIFDLTGKEITTLVNEELAAGKYNCQWNASNLSSGVYFYRLQSGSFLETKKLVLLR